MWTPQPGPQTAAYLSEADELLYGGQAGGGKTDLALGLARMEHRRSIVFRRTYPDVKRWLVPRSMEFYGHPSAYNVSDKAWKIDDRLIEFGHLESMKDLMDYQGVPYDLVAFEEVTQHPMMHYVRMLHSARTTTPGQRVRIVCTANPGGEGHAWVFERWAPWLDPDYPVPAMPGELLWFLRDDKGVERQVPRGTLHAMSRTFIPAKVSDNRYLGPDYVARLMNLPEPYRSQLRDGNWKAGLGDDDYKICPRSWVKMAVQRYRAWEDRGRTILAPKEDPEEPDVWIPSEVDVISVDVGEKGADPTCFGHRFGRFLADLEYYQGLSPMEVVSMIEQKHRKFPKAVFIVDGLNMGSGVVSRCYELDLPVISFIASHGSDLLDRSGELGFKNKRAEAWWALREQLDPAFDPEIGLPPDERLVGDLTAPRFEDKSGGLIQIQSKHGKGGLQELLARSTDAGDVAIQAFCPDARAGISISFR